MKKLILLIASIASYTCQSWAVARFPKPDFTSGYEYPNIVHPVPMEQFWNILDVAILVVMMSIVAWAIHKRTSRAAILSVSVVSVLYFGFFRSGCVCSVGSVQNVVLALADPEYHLPWYVLLVFLLPIVFTFIFGRVYCAGVCPLGALQELVNVKNFRINRGVASALAFIPWIYLAFAILYAATRSQFIICRLDPFVGIFRMGGDVGLITFGIILLLISVFVGRPFCQFLCPYGALLSMFGCLSIKKMDVTHKGCINCKLCHHSCPVDALRPPFDNRVREERRKGVNRLVLYFLLLPLLTVGMAWFVGSNADALSRAHKDVHLLDLVEEYNSTPDADIPLEVTAFNEKGGSIDVLRHKVEEVQHQYEFYGCLAGGLIGFVLGFKLIRFSTKRTRKTYEIDHATCVACGKCFDYCPQNKTLKK